MGGTPPLEVVGRIMAALLVVGVVAGIIWHWLTP